MMEATIERTRVRQAVDFNHVEERHREIDRRLVNWARWCIGRTGSGTTPMFDSYRSTEVWNEESGSGSPIDMLDATRIQKAVCALPTSHRLALSWSYIKRTSPRRAAQDLGESLEGLAKLVRDGRQMLINRGA